MSADSFPQEIVDQIVDNLSTSQNYQQLAALLSVSPTFHIRAQYHVFRSIDVGRGCSKDKLIRRLDLLAELIDSSAQSEWSPSIGYLITSFYLTIEIGAAEHTLISTPTSLISILSTLSSPDSNLVTMFLRSAIAVRHHCRFGKPLWDAYFALARAPKLANFGAYNLPVALWMQNNQIERLYNRTSIRYTGVKEWRECVRHPEAHEGTKDEMYGQPYPDDPNLVNTNVFRNLKAIVMTTSQMGRLMYSDDKGWPIAFPALVEATVYINTNEGIGTAMKILEASYGTLEYLHLDFTHDKTISKYSPRSVPFNLQASSFGKLAYLTLSDLNLSTPGYYGVEIYQLIWSFFEIVNHMLIDDPINPCPLRKVFIDLGWIQKSFDGLEKHLSSSDEGMWKELDNTLLNLIRLQPNQPPWFILNVRYPEVEGSQEELNEAVKLPKTRELGDLSLTFSDPEHNSSYHDPENDMRRLVNGYASHIADYEADILH